MKKHNRRRRRTRKTLLEHLPTELILEIFKFLSLRELIETFYGLNSHIDLIIQLVKSANHVVRYNDNKAIELFALFPNQIGHLMIINVEKLNIRSLTNIHSLTLTCATQTQLESIRPKYFPELEILHIKGLHGNVSDATRSINQLFELILSNGFPLLQICKGFRIGTLTFSKTWKGSTNLRILHLNLQTTTDCEQLRSICPQLHRLTTGDFSMVIDPTKGSLCDAPEKRLLNELKKLERLEFEGKFVLHENPLTPYGNRKLPPRFTNKSRRCHRCAYDNEKDGIALKGRIFPNAEPYCRASFLIEIIIPKDFPFAPPDVFFLDPIYHPAINEKCDHCRSCENILGNEERELKTPLAVFIEATIDSIDNIAKFESVKNKYAIEYKRDRQTFDKKALINTLLYGRPRD